MSPVAASDPDSSPAQARRDVLLDCHAITRYAGRRRLVDEVSLQLNAGEVTGLLGVNGAGKTTTMELLTGVLKLHGGQVTVCGFDIHSHPRDAKRHLGYLPERPPLYTELTCHEYLLFAGRLRGLSATTLVRSVDSITERCGIADVQHRLLGKLSRGMQQRVGVAQALIHDPSVVVLDEPSAGLDPLQMSEFRSLIRELANDKAVFLSTHVLSEVTALCHNAVILHEGRIVYQGTLDAAQGRRLALRVSRPPNEVSIFEDIESVSAVERRDNGEFLLDTDEPHAAADRIAARVLEQDLGLISLAPAEGELARRFAELTGATTDTV